MTPNEIQVQFSEEDLKQAKRYVDCEHCLVATALRRLGFEKIRAYPYSVHVDDSTYQCNRAIDSDALKDWDNWDMNDKVNAEDVPYKKELIGQTFIFTRI